jgi:hypothetical protein
MADETEHTTDTAGVSSMSTHAPTWQPESRSEGTSGGVGYDEPPNQEDVYGYIAPDAAAPTAPLLPLVIGLAVAGLAAAGAATFLLSRRAQSWSRTRSSRSTRLRSSGTLKQQLVDRPRRTIRPLRHEIRHSTAPLRRGVDSLARTTRDIQRNARDARREVRHVWQRAMTGGRWWRRGMIWGGALGIVIGFLLAPKPGRELRDDISRRFEQIRPQAEKLYQQGKAQVDRFMQARRG